MNKAVANKSGKGSNSDDPMALRNKIALLEDDLKRRQENYVLRERAHLTKIEELEEEIQNYRKAKTGWMQTDAKTNKLKAYQEQILDNVELVQERTGKILQEQERDLLRAFRARLFDIQSELERERNKKDEGADAWAEKGRQLEAELEWSKEVADRLERINQALTTENTRLKSQYQSQEDDRTFMIKQLVAIKKENAKFRIEYTALEEENKTMAEKLKRLQEEHSSREHMLETQKPRIDNNTEERYKDLNARLHRMLADERKNLHQVRQNYALELKTTTEMEMLLRQCVDDVRREIAKHHMESLQLAGSPTKRQQAQEFTQEDRARVLELLLSQEKVVTLLYAKAFPVNLRTGGIPLRSSTVDDERDAAVVPGGEAGRSLTLPLIHQPQTPSDRSNASSKQ